MIAKLAVAVPFTMILPDGTPFETFTYEDGDCKVVILPPGKSDVPIHGDVPEGVTIANAPAFAGNSLHFEFSKPSFNLDATGTPEPTNEVLARAVVELVARVRYVTRGFQAYTKFPNATWRLEYFNDDGSPYEPKKGEIRARAGRAMSWSFIAVTPEVWRLAHSLPDDWQPSTWDDILLDAFAAMPKIGTAVVLGATALEVFIAEVMEKLSKHASFPPLLWGWINDRGDWQKEPSPEEQFDQLLEYFTGHSLKSEKELWEAFKNLKNARNKFVHYGVPMVGGKALSELEAMRLLQKADEIIEWTRKKVPEPIRWEAPRTTADVQFQVRMF